MQRFWFDVVMDSINFSKQLLLIVRGVAGTGKSHTISGISHAIPNEVMRCAFTAKAAFIVRGGTLNSVFQIPVDSKLRSFAKLKTEKLAKMQNRFRNIKLVIIDEYSMLSDKMLGKIDQRLRQARGNPNDFFGGLSMILVGDLAQLPPVAAIPVYSHNGQGDLATNGFLAYRAFTKVIILTEMCRQVVQPGDTDQQLFVNLLNDLRNGHFSTEQWHFLRSRSPSNIQNFDQLFKHAIRLYSTNIEVNTRNVRKLEELGSPITVLKAVHNENKARSFDSDIFRGLENEIYISIGAEISLTSNLNTAFGLTNRQPGTIVDIVYLPHQIPNENLPEFVVVKIPRYIGPQFFTEEINEDPGINHLKLYFNFFNFILFQYSRSYFMELYSFLAIKCTE